jgi:uncharacterized UBP type Zn finger protein
MLTGYDATIVAYLLPDAAEFICAECAAKATSQLTVEKADLSLTPGRLEPVCRYTLDGYASETLWEYLSEEFEGEELQAAFDAAECQEPCGSCGANLL